MGSLSDYLENKVLDHIFGVASYSPPATVYLALSTADPTEDGSGLAEPSGNNYARKAITFGVAAARMISQNADVTFNQATGPWGTITHYALFSAASGGNMMAYGQLTTAKQVVAGNTPKVANGEVDVSFNSGAVFTAYANQILDWLFRAQALTQPTIYVGLSTTIPNDGGNVTEPSGNNYARKAQSSWTAAAGGATSNNGDVLFNTPSGSWGTIVYGVICDAATSGNPLFYGDVTDQAVDNGDTVKFLSGDIDVTLN